jgi:hypothetical protein
MASDSARPSKFGISWPWGVGIFLLFALLIVLAFRYIPVWVVDEGKLGTGAEELKAENDVRTAALQVIAGLVLASGLALTARSVALTARSVDLSRESLEVSRESQVTERFSRSVEQLGHENRREVRIGALYALERIASDSETDRLAVLEVVTAYIREHAKPAGEPEGRQGGTDVRPKRAMRGDIAAAINVIRRWRWPHDEPLDMEMTELPYANLSNADLSRADLSGANLSMADLWAADLTAAYLADANLSGAHFGRAELMAADLSRADLTGAELTGADLTGADLTGATLTRANLSDADLTKADLSRTNVVEASIRGARFNAGTVWPEHFDPEAAGAVQLSDWAEGFS